MAHKGYCPPRGLPPTMKWRRKETPVDVGEVERIIEIEPAEEPVPSRVPVPDESPAIEPVGV